MEILFALVYCSFYFHSEEAQEYVEIGSLNGLFVLGRTVGFIGKRAWSCAVVAGPATDLIMKHKTQLSLLFHVLFTSLAFCGNLKYNEVHRMYTRHHSQETVYI